jgi:hypothetical protein
MRSRHTASMDASRRSLRSKLSAVQGHVKFVSFSLAAAGGAYYAGYETVAAGVTVPAIYFYGYTTTSKSIQSFKFRPGRVIRLLEQDAVTRVERLQQFEESLAASAGILQPVLVPVQADDVPEMEPEQPLTSDGRTNYGAMMASRRVRRRVI